MKREEISELIGHELCGLDKEALRESIARHLTYTLSKTHLTATERDWFFSLVYAIRDRLAEKLLLTFHDYYQSDRKRVYYLSLEFLIGRTLNNSVTALGLTEPLKEIVKEVGLDLRHLGWLEEDAALGNGGLGRLAACLLDSMATLGLPGYGYGIRYEYGMFNQRIEDGRQVEHPENWLRYGNPWEFPRPELLYPVNYNGHVVTYTDDEGCLHQQWMDADRVMAMAYDMPIPGYGADTVNNLRLWTAKSSRAFGLHEFNEGDYIRSIEHKTASENLSRVLYPNDATAMGRELRLKQEYFFVSASLQDILRRFLSDHGELALLPDKVAIQLNDTHPAIAIAEWMRLLLDHHDMEWSAAWEITLKTFSYTNHTLLPEALETWPVLLLGRVLPRHLQIIYEINHRFLKDVAHRYPGDTDKLRRLSLINEEGDRYIRMAHLAIVGSHCVNGVSQLHSRLLQEQLFADFHAMFPDRFINITNGVTPRRWLHQANPELSALISKHIGSGWQTDLSRLRELEPLADNPEFRTAFRQMKMDRKGRLHQLAEWRTGIVFNSHALYDVQVKRIHEYKRQLLNLLHVITLYNRLREGRVSDPVPRIVIFAGKAAPGYEMAKLIIKLINDVSDVVNNDPLLHDQLKVVFIPNYDVSTAMEIIPAADLSEQISTAGMEASGTGNMKLSLNGALTIGTLDGANIEIREEVGEENFFLFGMTAEEVEQLKRNGYEPAVYYRENSELKQTIDQIANGFFSPGAPNRYRSLVDQLVNHDPFMVLADYADYVRCQGEVERLFQDQDEWDRRAILNLARMGKFSSDRTVREYADKVWQLD